MAKFHSLKIKEVRRETDDCVSIAFDVPAELTPEYQYQPGQHLTLRKKLNGEELRRTYSICAAPFENELRVAVKKVEGGRFSSFANELLAAGENIDVLTPMGNFTVNTDVNHEKFYVAFAAGSGITPVISLMKTILKKEPKSFFTLFYGNQASRSIIFLEEIEALKNQYLGRLSVHHVLSREHPGNELFYGRISKDKCDIFLKRLVNPVDVDEFFLCGPEEMIEAARQSLQAAEVPDQKIHFELFTTPEQKAGQKTQVKKTDTRAAILSQIAVTLDGKTFSFELPSTGDTILDAASAYGADLPFACKGGVCCTCKAKVLEGEVEMDVNYALVEEELKAGYVLTCQSHPKTEYVHVSFDE